MRIITYIILSCFIAACSQSRSGGELEQALKLSGENRNALEAVLGHYKHDSLKYRATSSRCQTQIAKCRQSKFPLKSIRFLQKAIAWNSGSAMSAGCTWTAVRWSNACIEMLRLKRWRKPLNGWN